MIFNCSLKNGKMSLFDWCCWWWYPLEEEPKPYKDTCKICSADSVIQQNMRETTPLLRGTRNTEIQPNSGTTSIDVHRVDIQEENEDTEDTNWSMV